MEVPLRSVAQKRRSAVSVRRVGEKRCSEVSLKTVDQKCRAAVSLRSVSLIQYAAQICGTEVWLRTQQCRSGMSVDMLLELSLKSVAQKRLFHLCVEVSLDVLPRRVASVCVLECRSVCCSLSLRSMASGLSLDA